MQRFSWLVAGLLTAVALAGCSDDPGPSASGDDDAFQEFDLEATKDTGLIRGIVVDPAVVPLPAVTVTIQGDGRNTTTNEQGAFGFSAVPPGTYFLEASKEGFIPTQQTVTVIAGEEKPDILRIQLQPDPAAQPFSETVPFNGFIACSFTLVLVSFAACGLNGVSGITGNSFLQNLEWERVPEFVQSEMLWDSTQSLGDSMSVSWTDPRGAQTGINGSSGPTPQYMTMEREQFEAMNLTGVNIWLRVFSTSREGTDNVNEETWNAPWRSTVYPTYNNTAPQAVKDAVHTATTSCIPFVACLLDPVGEDCVMWFVLFNSCMNAGGVGVTLQQPFQIFTTTFYGYAPPEGWMFSTDGSVPPP